ncbi:MAG: hypothetical protein M3Q56_01460 [Bacteroidota bacterium]|nr:hypothetical protein [Bacteroidota bacterium]
MNLFSIPRIIFLLIVYSNLIWSQGPTPIFRLDASQGVQKTTNKVTRWADISNNVTALQNLPANQAEWVSQGIGDRPSILFNGTSTFMNMPSIFPTQRNYTIIVVCKANAPSANILGGNSRTLWMGGGTAPIILHNGDFNNQAISSIDPGLQPSIIVAQYNHATQSGIFYINGQFADSAFVPINVDSTMYISAYQGGYHFNGLISEMILYDNLINTLDRKKIEKELFEKYKIDNPEIKDSTFTVLPDNYQLFARDENNEAIIKVEGTIRAKNYDSLYVLLYKDSQLVERISKKLNFNPKNEASFFFQPKITAGLSNYSVELRIKNALRDSFLIKKDHIVCGDVYLINGQSNSIFGGNVYYNEFCRTFGKNFSTRLSDTLWAIASGSGYGGGPDIGAWGMELARRLIETYKIPICIINGGVGGTSIQQHQRDDINPALPVTIYGSLLYRVQKSELASAAKAMFWYQGESNNSILYFENFKALYQDWKTDYPALKKYYVVQIHHGCGAGDHAAVREVLRRLPETFPDITLISTNNLPGHDGCHYTVGGYKALANNIFPLVDDDFYLGAYHPDNHPPNIKQAYFSKKDFSEITLIFNPQNSHIRIPNDSIVNGFTISIKDYFALDQQFRVIKNIRSNKDSVFLELKNPTLAKSISYLTEVNYLEFNGVYEGPYVVNEKQIGALSFHNFPILEKVPTGVHQSLHENQQNVLIFPNPINKSDHLQVNISLDTDVSKAQFCLKNLKGQTVSCAQFPILQKGKYSIQLKLNNQVDDFLIWEFITSNNYSSGKLILK